MCKISDSFSEVATKDYCPLKDGCLRRIRGSLYECMFIKLILSGNVYQSISTVTVNPASYRLISGESTFDLLCLIVYI